ncbi:ankyrin repeat-containing protein ITN1-like [Mangifera indica]|uniref:ankyrin repeat-containing protein ITN1-like n=1 Tax=Mangifera indica TaxID=29780 RepID=UPI001CFB27B0|nr:ankyrin repeat-containing protein ITN1-like [Mangifera indica]
MAGFAGIATEKLTEENYENWKECLKNYFIANDLWDVVKGVYKKPEASEANYKEWVKKNAMALHAIQISCKRDTMSKLRGNESAEDEWNLLANKNRTKPPKGGVDIKEEEQLKYRDISKAVERGDWAATRTFLEERTDAIKETITLNGDTVLHVAVMAEQTKILEKLLEYSTKEDLEVKNNMGYTAFFIAAINGFKDMVEIMLEKDNNLVRLKDAHNLIPIVAASFYGSREMVRYLYTKTPHEELSPEHTDRSGATLLNCLISDELYDVALHLLEKYPHLAFVEDLHRNYAIKLLAHKRSAFPSGNRYVFWKQWIYSCIRVTVPQYDTIFQSSDEESNVRIQLKLNIQQVLFSKLRGLIWNILAWINSDLNHLYERKFKHIEAIQILKCVFQHIPYFKNDQLEKFGWDEAIYDAIKNGIVEFVDEAIESTPEIIWRKDKNGRTIFADAIIQRQENIFSHVYKLGAKMRIAVIRHDIFGNNFLHLAAKLGPPSQLDRISGAALQMQRELEWFEEVSRILPPKYMEEVNENNKTPSELFTEAHAELVNEGERWMKNTAASCMVVATLIAAVMFTSAFTVPGGNDQRDGTPIMLNRKAFLIFVVSNALSLFSSSTSVLVFLGILTSRYAEKDFRTSLPTKLIVGLFTLFFSIVTMMACFGAAISLLLEKRLKWVGIPVIILSLIPIFLYASFQFPLLIEILIYTCGGGIFKKKKVTSDKKRI